MADPSWPCDTYVKLWDGTNVFAEGASTARAATYDSSVTLQAVVVLTGTTTVKVSGASSNTNSVIRKTLNRYTTSGKATRIVAVQIA
jgi:hypothetical protein